MKRTLLKRKYRYIEVLVKDEYRNCFVSFNVPYTQELNEYVSDLIARKCSPRCYVRIRIKNDGCPN